jgi:glutaminyl-peptide cyclotransferase
MKYARILVILLLFSFVISLQAQNAPQGFLTVQNYQLEVLNTYPHDPNAFTQGLIWYEGSLYESTGLRGESTLREVDLTTGDVIRSVPLTRSQEELDSGQLNYFAEGLELVNGNLIQLTWQSNTAFVYDFETFERVGEFSYENEGWGLCSDGRYLYHSDSSQYLAVREADTFELIARMLVTFNGQPVEARRLNELACVGDYIYANWWQSDVILQIDKFSGNVVGLIDARDLLTDEMKLEMTGASSDEATGEVRIPAGSVLNGIAYNPDSETFYITGKKWSRLFEVRFVPVDG